MRTQRQDQPAARAAGDTVERSGSRNGVDVDRDRSGSRDPVGIDRERQRDEFGGFNWGAAFFGWLVAVGITALLTALLSAAGAAIGLTELSGSEASDSADTISIVGGALLIAVLALGYYAGGYVAGRMSRFDGGRQGLGVWLIGLAVTVLLAAVGAIAGSEYNLLGQLNLPRIPIDEGSLATGAAIALALLLIVTVVAAIFGGKVGERYHRKVDRVGLHRD
jgi:MFS family permease